MSSRCRRMLPALMIIAGVAGADFASARSFSLCAEHNSATRELVLTMSSGCVSSSLRYKGHDLETTVSHFQAAINVSGDFNYDPARGNIVTADCMNGKRHTVTVPDAEARRYHVSHNGEYLGVADLTAGQGPVCLKPSRSKFNPVIRFSGWQSVDLADWQPKSAASLMDVVAPIYSGHPESPEGHAVTRIEMAPAGRGEAYLVRITMTGYLDDSVAGERFSALVAPGGEGWVLQKLWKLNLCARGTHAGQWTPKACP